ncbi:MAG: glutamate racemase [Candidatus Campbellbacteria bacterium]
MAQNKKIGVFDSGFGGIDILRGIVSELPQYDYIYLGDTARSPYGTRSSEVVYEFSKQAVDFLFSRGAGLIIFACNTASSDALRRIQQEYLPRKHPDKRVLGVLIPAAEDAVAKTKNGRVGVIATEGTVRSCAFPRELIKLKKEVQVFQQACPLLVPLVEEGEERSKAAHILVEQYLAPLRKKKIDTLILGCTHYGLLERQIKKAAGSHVRIVSEARVVPKKLRDYLRRHQDIEGTLSKHRSVQFFSTDLTERFTRLGSRFFGKKIRAAKAVLK